MRLQPLLLLVTATIAGASVFDPSDYKLIARYHASAPMDYDPSWSYNSQPLSPTNQPNPYVIELAATISYYTDAFERDLFVQVGDVVSTHGWTIGETFFASLLTSIDLNLNSSLFTNSDFSFNNVGQEVYNGFDTPSLITPANGTYGWSLGLGNLTATVHTTATYDYAMVSYASVTGALVSRGGGVFAFHDFGARNWAFGETWQEHWVDAAPQITFGDHRQEIESSLVELGSSPVSPASAVPEANSYGITTAASLVGLLLLRRSRGYSRLQSTSTIETR